MAKVTIKSLADAFSVSKPTIRAYMLELDPEGRHVHKEGQAFILDDELASMIADKLSQRPGYVPPKPDEVTSSPSMLEALLDNQRQSLSAKDETIAMLQARIAQLEMEVDALKLTIADKDAEIRNQAARLEMSRRLEGFHLPWIRQRIINDYSHLLK